MTELLETIRPVFVAAGWTSGGRVDLSASVPLDHPASAILAEFGDLEERVPFGCAGARDLIRRIRALGEGHEWVFRSRKGTPINPGNALRRHLHPVTEAVGVHIGGFHDFRHTLYRTMRREGIKPRVISDVLGHEGVNVGATVYDRANRSDLRDALGVMSKQLQSSGELAPTMAPNPSVQ